MTTQEMNTADALRAILDNLEAEQAIKNSRETISYINKPEKISISSNDAEQASNEFNSQVGNSFYSFKVDLPRPALDVKSLELLSANIPQAQVNIPDDSLIFFYYRIKMTRNFDDTQTVIRESPSINNLYYVRLLPSYYKKELIPNYTNYGFNRTFVNYEDVATELVKSCATDLAYVNVPNNALDNFIPNDISIVYNEDLNKFQMVANNINTAWDYAPYYVGSKTYSIGDIVRVSTVSGFYTSLVNDNSGNQPNTSPTQWSYSLHVAPTWNLFKTYNQNDIVYYSVNNSYYISTVNNNVGSTPTALTNWALFDTIPSTLNKQWYTYLVAGYEDPNVYTLSETLNSIFLGIDFNMNSFVSPATAQLYSIPPQPVIQYQTLNLRLGFTWNGFYNWSFDTEISVTTQNSLDQNGVIITFNRLRPIPQYQISFGLGETYSISAIPSVGNPYTSTTYTADNFANLVYSSIVSVYTSIIGPSTTDTQRNTNLLSIVPMDCNNLGITFYEPRISAKLTKIVRDIYSIYFEFRREDGEPYYFSNNAIITLQLGLTY
jgi:hypothetical protein